MAAFLILAALLAAQPPAEPDWRPLGDVAGRALAWDSAGIVRDGDLVRVGVRTVRAPPVEGANASSLSRIEIRCAEGRARVVETINYASDGSAGSPDADPQPWVAIVPDSFFATLREAVCPSVPAPA